MQTAIPWPEIIREHGPSVWRTVYRLLANQEDAAECYQEVFVDAVRLAKSQTIDSWGAVLTTIATRRAVDRLRQRITHQRRHTSSESADAVADRGRKPMDELTDEELTERLRDALAGLPENQAEAFWLNHMEQQTYEEIATRLSLTIDHVGVLLYRARAKLRDTLGRQLLEERSPQ
jgi:RNA polymerase sigma-70 factor (ECF subfamily)